MTGAVAVMFIARGVGGGLSAAHSFLESYRANPAGTPHELFVIRKGYESDAERDEVGRVATGYDARVTDLPDDGYDWGAYLRACTMLPHEWVFLLNTHSRIEQPDWLRHMVDAAGGAGVGAVGGTGSWQSLAPGLRFVLPLARWVAGNRTLAHGTVEALQQLWAVLLGRQHPRGRDFPRFPNPHLRSNALLIRRDLLAEFGTRHAMPQDKHGACLLESGHRGLSRFLAGKNMSILVASADGRAYTPDAWDQSGTFRTPGQPNLLVSDNQTRAYASGTERERQFLEMMTWGRTVSA